jgi:capsular polysaccharide biosynthesis protein
VIRKLLEAFFQHKLLLLLPPILITGIVAPVVVLTTPPAYESSVSVWIDRPTYLNYKDPSTSWLSPVQSQSNRLNELLHTRAFLTDVAARTSLAPLNNSAAGQARIADLMNKSVTIGGASTITTASEHLLVVRVAVSSAQLSFELCKGIIDAYQEKTAADQADQAGVAVDFYAQRVKDLQVPLNTASQNLRRYVASRQDADPGQALDGAQLNLPAAMLDPRLGALQTAVQAAQVDVNTAQAALSQAQQDALTSATGQQYGFQVLDAPQLPTAPTSQIKKIIIYPIAAFVVGLALSATLLVLFVYSDRSVRSEVDLAPGLRLLGSVPHLQLKKLPKKLRSGATRRAIGSSAGTALPIAGGAK